MAESTYTPRPFRPAWWLPGPHAQTLGARLLRGRDGVAYRRWRVETPDGDFLDLDVSLPPTRSGPDTPLVVVLHGLEGCSRSGYVLEICRLLRGRGMGAVAMNFRSRSGEPNRRPGSYHAGISGDLALVLDHLRARRPEAPLAAVGFSLGGNVLLKYLGERGEDARDLLRAAVAVSVPLDLSRSADRMETGVGRVYSRFFLTSLVRSARAKARRFPEALDPDRLGRIRTIREFDDAVTAPLHGFRGAEHYYEASSSGPLLERIRVPTLLLQARDDPIIPEAAIPWRSLRANPWLVDGVTDHGGHVGFVAGDGPGTARFWAEEEALRFVDAHLDAAKG